MKQKYQEQVENKILYIYIYIYICMYHQNTFEQSRLH